MSIDDVTNLEAIALGIARKCRCIIQTCLREEEWSDADVEFTNVILNELKRFVRRLRLQADLIRGVNDSEHFI